MAQKPQKLISAETLPEASPEKVTGFRKITVTMAIGLGGEAVPTLWLKKTNKASK